MKKLLAVFAVLALTVVSSVAFAEVSVSGSIDIRNLATNNTTDFGAKPAATNGSDENRTTQERIRINIDAKHEGVKGRVTIENDWDVFGRVEAPQGAGSLGCVDTNSNGKCDAGEADNNIATAGEDVGRLKIREGWIDFSMPFGLPGHIKVGHQFLQLSNGWFFRSGKYGSDAWLLGFPGRNTVAFVDVKASEWKTAANDDTDAYVLLDVFKIDDNNTVGANFTYVRDPNGNYASVITKQAAGAGQEADLQNIGLHYNGKVGPLKLQAEIDIQSGTYDLPGKSIDFSGNQLVLQASMPMDALTVNATIASGSGDKDGAADNKVENIVTLLDADPHYTFVYEYFSITACGAKNTGFCNTQALNLGASYKVSKNLTVALDYWMLTANEKVTLNKGLAASDDLGSEIDAKILWTLNDNLSWNWQLGRLMPGKAYDNATTSAEDVDAIQGVLSYKF